MEKPIIAITMGDPAGIGPELVIKVLSKLPTGELCRPLVIGDLQVMKQTARLLGSNLTFRVAPSPDFAAFAWPEVDLLCPEDLRLGPVTLGKVDPEMGEAAAICLRKAVLLALNKQIQGIVSSPLNKEAFHLAGFNYRDEIAYIAKLSHCPAPAIVGIMKHIWTITVTEHIPLKSVYRHIKKEKIISVIDSLHRLLKDRGIVEPKIAVAALNPHAGDGGVIGKEEVNEIRPAIEAAQALGFNISGPIPADVVFGMALSGMFDGVVCMYHDQANIARKLQPKEESATLFYGFPFAIGTTAHGTAFDIAGQGIADYGSLDLALRSVAKIAVG